jgi:membrane-associated phospholipid phosphatase
VYGLIIYLVLRRTNLTRTKWAVGAWSVLALAVYTEAYSRLYLGKHWISDIVGGLVFGGLLLVLFIAMTKLLDEPDPGPGPEPDDTSGTPKRIFAGSQY